MDAIFKSHYVRFIGGGIICAGINNVVLIVGDYFGIGYVLLTFICYFLSGTAGYIFHSRITFQNRMTPRGYLNFIFGISLGLPVSLVILAALSDGLSLPMWIAAPTMSVLMVAYHYLIARLAITPRLAASTAHQSHAGPEHDGLRDSPASAPCVPCPER